MRGQQKTYRHFLGLHVCFTCITQLTEDGLHGQDGAVAMVNAVKRAYETEHGYVTTPHLCTAGYRVMGGRCHRWRAMDRVQVLLYHLL